MADLRDPADRSNSMDVDVTDLRSNYDKSCRFTEPYGYIDPHGCNEPHEFNESRAV